MESNNPIRILIVDDSRIFRGQIQSVLEQMPDVCVVGSVFSGEKALEFLRTQAVDLITLDIEMPGLSGLDTLRHIAIHNQRAERLSTVDVLLVSALTRSGSMVTVEGLQLGAFDFIAKPIEGDQQSNREQLRRSLADKLFVYRKSKHKRGPKGPIVSIGNAVPVPVPQSQRIVRAIAVGTSTGGPEALSALVPALAAECDAPVFIVQHFPDGMSYFFAESLSRKCPRPVIEVQDGMMVERGGIYLAKGGMHMLVRPRPDHCAIGYSDAPPEHGFKPAVDVFLRSAAVAYGPSLITLILTGMGDDGASGACAVKRAGGYVIAQDQASSVVWGMPSKAIGAGGVDVVLPLNAIVRHIVGMIRRSP